MMIFKSSFNLLSSKFYLTELVAVGQSELDRESVLGLIFRITLDHKKFWGKIDKQAYAYAFYFSLHERWSIQKFKEDNRFDLDEYHTAYWLNVIRSMHKAQHSDVFIKTVISVAMKNFLAIPYQPKYEVLVPYFSAIIGGRSKHTVQETALIKALKEEENHCSVPMDENWKIQIIEGKNINVAISDLENSLLGLIVPLLFRQVTTRRNVPIEKGSTNVINKTSVSMNSTVEAKEESNNTDNEEVELEEARSEIEKSSELSDPRENTVSQPEQNQSKLVNLLDFLRKYRKVIAITLIVFAVVLIYGNKKIHFVPDKKLDEGVKQIAIQCVTLQRKISVLQNMESNKARKQLINLYNAEYQTECKSVSHTSKEYAAAISYVSQNSKLIAKRIKESIELAETSLAEESHYKNGKDNQMVLQAQIYLNRLGYKIVVNGHYDTKTLQAVRAFQKRIGVSQTGIINQKLLTELSSELTLEGIQ